MRFALVKDDKIVNVIIADDLITAQNACPDFEVLEASETLAGIGYERINGVFVPPRPFGSSADVYFDFEKNIWVEPSVDTNDLTIKTDAEATDSSL